MEPTIAAAIVSGVSVIVAPVLTLVLKRHFDNRLKLPISVGRREAITGRWEGKAFQKQGPDGEPFDFPIKLDIVAGRKTISGTLAIWWEKDEKKDQAYFKVSGGFFHGQFLLLNYMPRDESTIQFGSVTLKLDASGKRLEGRYSGYGRLTESVVSGTTKLEKVT